MGTLTTVFGHILNIASGQSTTQEQNYGAKQNAGSRIGAADHSYFNVIYFFPFIALLSVLLRSKAPSVRLVTQKNMK